MTSRYKHKLFTAALLLVAAGTASATCTNMITPPDNSGVTYRYACASVNQDSPAANQDATVAAGSDITIVAGVFQVSDPFTAGLPSGWEGGAQMSFVVDGKTVTTLYTANSYPQYATYVVKGLANGTHKIHTESNNANIYYQVSPDVNVYVGTAAPAVLNGVGPVISEYVLDN